MGGMYDRAITLRRHVHRPAQQPSLPIAIPPIYGLRGAEWRPSPGAAPDYQLSLHPPSTPPMSNLMPRRRARQETALAARCAMCHQGPNLTLRWS